MSDILYDRDPIKFAYWVPNVSGGLVISDIEQRTDWSIDYNRKLAQIAERSGFDYALSQIRFTAGYGAEYQHGIRVVQSRTAGRDHHPQSYRRHSAGALDTCACR